MAIVTAMVASSRGRSALGFFFYGLLVWPIALTHALLSPKPSEQSSPGYAPGPAGAPRAFVPHGLIGERPFRQNNDGTITALIDGREVLFPDRRTAASALGGELKAHLDMPVVESDFDDDDETAGHPAGRSYPSFVAGLSHSVRWKGSTRSRSRYAVVEIRPGDRLEVVRTPDHPDDPGAVALSHNGFPLGFVPRRHAWVGQALDEGDVIQIVVDTVAPSRENPQITFIGTRVHVLADG
ncbi:HIRAN domain-containing protein [Bosea sp. LjRoot90]|uniref:HIRAN domain-containing protein n=1 Tax=Bosea sp. LjRoot90 TaxID=3342342 RepID=UPI003ECE1F5B